MLVSLCESQPQPNFLEMNIYLYCIETAKNWPMQTKFCSVYTCCIMNDNKVSQVKSSLLGNTLEYGSFVNE